MKDSMLIAIAALAAIAAAVCVACGVKSPPEPLAFSQPQQILDLHASSEKTGVRLTWGRPITHVGGGKLRDLASFVVLRSVSRGPLTEIGRVAVTDSQRFQQQRTFDYLDRHTLNGQSYSYEVVSMTAGGNKSQPSNEVTITKSIPPPPPNPENFVVPTPGPLP